MRIPERGSSSTTLLANLPLTPTLSPNGGEGWGEGEISVHQSRFAAPPGRTYQFHGGALGESPANIANRVASCSGVAEPR